MAKVRFMGLRGDLDTVLERLYRNGQVELVPAHAEGAVGVSPLPDAERLEARANALRALLAELEALLRLARDEAGLASGTTSASTVDALDLDALRAELEEPADGVRAAARRLDRLRDEHSALVRYAEPLGHVLPLVPELASLDEADLVALRLDTVALVLEAQDEQLVALLREELAERLGSRFELASRRTDAETVVCLLAYPHDEVAVVRDLLAHEQVRHVALPERFERLSLRNALEAMRRRLRELPGELDGARGELRGCAAPHLERWQTARAVLHGELERVEARANVGVTSRAFVLLGWTPRARLGALRRELASWGNAPVALDELGVPRSDAAPVLLRNRPPARPFETLVRIFELPRSGSFDPSALMALFLPLMFGVMVGDVVYGAVLLGLALWLRRRFAQPSPLMADITRIVAAGSVWAIAFGVLFGEALGNFGRRYLGMEPLWFYRGSPDAIEPLFTFVLALGGAHIALGLLLGIWQAARAGERRDLLDRGSTLAAVAGAFALAGVALDVLPNGSTGPALAAILTGLAAMIALHGSVGPIMGPVELAGALGNVLSYLRLAAVGLASVYLAIVANEFAVVFPLAVGLVIAALLHILNLALAGFSPMVQSVRLHYVEFFSKFYAGGGRAFRPFGASPAFASEPSGGPRRPRTIDT